MIPFRGRVTLSVLLIAAIPPAGAAKDLAACAHLISQDPQSEPASLCLYELAEGTSRARAAAIRELEELQAVHPDGPWPSLYLGKVRWRAGDRDEAEKLYRRAIAVAVRLGRPRAELLARSALCRILRDTGRMEMEANEVERVNEIAQRTRDPFLLTKAGILQASHWNALGNLEESYSLLGNIEEYVKKDGSYPLTREYLFTLNLVTQQTGRFRETRLSWQQLADLAAANGDVSSEALARYGLAKTRLDELSETPEAGGREEVLGLARRSLAVSRAAQRPSEEASSLWLLGSLEQGAEAVDHLEKCFAVAATSAMRSHCRGALAKKLAPSDPAAAEGAIDEALRLSREAGDVWSQTSAWHARMRVSWATHPPGQALKDSLPALNAIESLRDLQEGSARQPGLFSTWAEDYYWLSGRLLETGDARQAFGVIERMRSRTLTDSLGLSRHAPETAELRAARAGLFVAIAQVQRRLLDPALSPRERAAEDGHLRHLERQEEDLRAQIARADPAQAALRPPDFASLEQVRGALAGDEALLSFQIAPWKDLAGDFGGGSWLLVSTRDAPMRLYPLPDRTWVRSAVDTFTGMFAPRDGSEREAAPKLYAKLLRPALAELPPDIRRLVIVPDDFLHRLPFSALRPEAHSDPLATRYEITLTPSATLWLHWRQFRPALAVTQALVLADPVTLVTRGDAAGERSATLLTPAGLGKLPHARDEGRAVRRYLGGDLLEGEDASEAYLKRNGAGRFGLVHFAAHAVTDEVDPDRSGIYLSPGNDKEDGVLQAREIADLNLDGRIVVLSTCESASGEILRGEGVMGLARAFFQAKAHTVVASLWPLRDDYGAALFDRFYHHLGKGKSVAAALQAAQRDRMNDGAPAEAWAGVVVLGDGDRVPVPGGRGPGLLPWALGLGLLAAALLAYRVLARQRRKTTA